MISSSKHSPLKHCSLTIATRQSRLAVAQTQIIGEQIKRRFGFETQLLKLSTQGDRVLDKALSAIGGKGIFVKELEKAMLDGQAQLAVHSLKDVPMQLPQGFVLAAIPPREDPRDAFISNRYANLNALPQGAVVGTSSLRRQVLLRDLRPDLRIELLRGNLDTRLRKLDEGHYDAIVLAVSGLNRLQLQNRIRMAFNTKEMIPSAGQGALGIEMHTSQSDLIEIIAGLTDKTALITCTAERAVSRALGGNCSVPLAAHAVLQDDNQRLVLDAAWGDVDGKRCLIRVQKQCELTSLEQKDILILAQSLGQQVATELVSQGATIARQPTVTP